MSDLAWEEHLKLIQAEVGVVSPYSFCSLEHLERQVGAEETPQPQMAGGMKEIVDAINTLGRALDGGDGTKVPSPGTMNSLTHFVNLAM